MSGSILEVRQSDIKKWLGCKRQFFLENTLAARQVYHGERDMVISNADVGTLVHAGMEAFYLGGGVKEAIYCDSQRMAVEREFDQQLFLAANTAKLTMALLMVERYASWHDTGPHKDAHLEVVDTEHRFNVRYDVGSTTVLLTGHSDLIMHDEVMDAELILDHKTVANLNQTPRPGDFQLQHYAMLRFMETGKRPYAAGHNALKRVGGKGKGPFVDRYLINITPDSIMRHIDMLDRIMPELVHDLLEAKEAAMFPNMTGECKWKCRVYDVCDGMDDGSDWQYTAETEYQIDRDKIELHQ
jgi:hypothetical protein